MSGYTYPAPAQTGSNLTVQEIHHLLKTPQTLARRVRTLASQRYIADFLLKGRFVAQGGGIFYETGESLFTEDAAEEISPGGAFPRTKAASGEFAAAKVSKWGRDLPITDEAISRLKMSPVNKGLTKLVNMNVKTVDSAALGVIASKLTATFNVTAVGNPGAWATAAAIVNGVLQAKAQVDALDEGYTPDAIVLTDLQWAKAMGLLWSAGILPRENGNPLLTGEWPEVLGLTWTKTSHSPSTNPFLVDTEQLGGMADEKIESPGYSQAADGVGVEVKSLREEKEFEGYLVRARRVTVPIVLEPLAGIVFTNTGL
jgi:hypothetical protein